MERRRCGHHTLDQPLSTIECISSVIDPKGSRTNKNRYVVASQEDEVRRHCRGIKGVPLVYVKRSVMVMEPMSEGSAGVREGTEREKFRSGIRGRLGGLKRKRDDEELDGPNTNERVEGKASEKSENLALRRKTRGPKGPNPLSVKKAKRPTEPKDAGRKEEGIVDIQALAPRDTAMEHSDGDVATTIVTKNGNSSSLSRKKKRRRKPSAATVNPALANGHDGDSS